MDNQQSISQTLQSLERFQGDVGIERNSLSSDPFEQFASWMQLAIDAEIEMPNMMTVATASADGRPSARLTLLKGFDDRGFVFYTNFESQKGRELRENPYAALVFYWSDLSFQVRVEGRVARVADEESVEYFQSRSRGSQIGAWASRQSAVLESRESLMAQVREIEMRFPEGDLPLPPHWGGFRLEPDKFEFWKSRQSRLHDRFRYSLQPDGQWLIERLSP